MSRLGPKAAAVEGEQGQQRCQGGQIGQVQSGGAVHQVRGHRVGELVLHSERRQPFHALHSERAAQNEHAEQQDAERPCRDRGGEARERHSRTSGEHNYAWPGGQFDQRHFTDGGGSHPVVDDPRCDQKGGQHGQRKDGGQVRQRPPPQRQWQHLAQRLGTAALCPGHREIRGEQRARGKQQKGYLRIAVLVLKHGVLAAVSAARRSCTQSAAYTNAAARTAG